MDTYPGSTEVVARSWVELFSASLLANSGLPNTIVLELLTIAAGMNPLVMSPTESGSCEVIGLITFSKGSSG